MSFAEISSFSHLSSLWWQSSERIEIYAICSCQRGYVAALIVSGTTVGPYNPNLFEFSGLSLAPGTQYAMVINIANGGQGGGLRLAATTGDLYTSGSLWEHDGFMANNNSPYDIIFEVCPDCLVDAGVTILPTGGLMADAQAGVTYQWYSCVDSLAIAEEFGGQDQTFIGTGGQEFYVVVTDTAAGCSNSSTCIMSIVGVDEIDTHGTFTLYPNPSDGIFEINHTFGNESLYLEVFNAVGQSVHTQTISTPSASIDIHSVPAGIYIVKLAGPRSDQTIRLLKQ